MTSLDKLFQVIEKGGYGSGNFGHGGIPGHQGGSTPGSGMGGGSPKGENVYGSPEILQVVSEPSHPLNALYQHGNSSFESESVARVDFGKNKNRGQYRVALTDEGKVHVMGQPPGTKKMLNKEFPSVDAALHAATEHFEGKAPTKFLVAGSAEYFKKYPETKRLQDDKTSKNIFRKR